MISGVYWSVGARENNEDSIAIESVKSEKGDATIAIVADGIGSLFHCEIASGYVVECFLKWFYQSGIRMGSKPKWRVRRSLQKCSYECCHKMKVSGERNTIRWGSTCALVCLWKNRYVAMNIGDSAVILVGELGARRLFEPDINNQGMLTRAMGTMRYQKPTIRFGKLHNGEGLLLASDGFANSFTNEELYSALHLNGEISDERVNNILRKLGKECERRGGKDNRSAIYIQN